jgi:hypothetical protein
MVGVGRTVKLEELSTVTPLVVTDIFPVDVPEGTIAVMAEAVDDNTVAETPLKDTSGEALKLLPLMVMVAPSAPLEGVKPEIAGVGNTRKLDPLLIVIPFTLIEIGPVFAPTGTVVAILDVVPEVTVAVVPLKVTPCMVLKFVPEMVTAVLTAPLMGLNPVMVGVGNTVKIDPEVMVTPFTVMDIAPVVAPAGTAVVIVVVVNELTDAVTPLKDTVGVVLKFVPVMVTIAPSAPLVGLKPLTVGVDRITKLLVLKMVTPLTVTEIFPEVAPGGTKAVMLLVVEAVITAVVLLNLTI